jgi:hypothetical protein
MYQAQSIPLCPDKTNGIFLGLRAACPDQVANSPKEWENWMFNHVHQLWRNEEISDQQLAVLVDYICTF